MTTRNDPRYVTSDDPKAVLCAWYVSEDGIGEMDMGGWSDDNRADFEAAVLDELLYVGDDGSDGGKIVIKPARGDG